MKMSIPLNRYKRLVAVLLFNILLLVGCDVVGPPPHKPDFPDNFAEMQRISEPGISADTYQEVFEMAVKVQPDKLVIPERELLASIRYSEVFDCRPYILSSELKEALQNSERLKFLCMSSHIDASDLIWITKIKSLRGLDIADCDLSDADMSLFARLPELRQLNLTSSTLPQSKTSRLTSIPKLEILSMTGVSFDKNTFSHAQLPNLRVFAASSSNFSNSDLQHLVKICPNIELMSLAHCPSIDAESVSHLSKLKKLKYLHVGSTALEKQTYHCNKLQRNLPKCNIAFGT